MERNAPQPASRTDCAIRVRTRAALLTSPTQIRALSLTMRVDCSCRKCRRWAAIFRCVLRLRLAAGPLGARDFRRRLAEVPRVRDPRSRGQGREVLQVEIDTDLSRSGRKVVRNVADEVQIPAPLGILAETARADVGRDPARQPEPVLLSEKSDTVALDLERAGALERHPPQGPFRPAAGPPARAPLCLVPADGELLAHGLDGVAVQSEFPTGPTGQPDQVETARPGPVQPAAVVLYPAAVVSDEIDRPRHAGEALASRGVLDAVAVRQYHPRRLVGLGMPCKTSGAAGTAYRGSPSIWPASRSPGAACLTIQHWNGFTANSPKCAGQWIVRCSPATVKRITSMRLSIIHRSCRFRLWSMPLNGHPAVCSDRSARTSRNASGTAFCGRPHISSPAQEGQPLKPSNSMSPASAAPPLHLEERGFAPGDQP
jgi:hypothetical protein